MLSGIVERVNTDSAKKYGVKFSWYRTPNAAINICLLLFSLPAGLVFNIWRSLSSHHPRNKDFPEGPVGVNNSQERKLREGVF